MSELENPYTASGGYLDVADRCADCPRLAQIEHKLAAIASASAFIVDATNPETVREFARLELQQQAAERGLTLSDEWFDSTVVRSQSSLAGFYRQASRALTANEADSDQLASMANSLQTGCVGVRFVAGPEFVRCGSLAD